MVFGRRLIPLVARIGVRPRLSLIALIAIAPLFALLIAGAVKDRHLTLEAAKIRALDLARLGAERQDDAFQHARDVLTVIRKLPPVVDSDPETCGTAFRTIAAEYPQFTSIGLVDATGMVSCISLPVSRMAFRDMEAFRAAMAGSRTALTIGKFMIGPITGKPIVVVALPMLPRGQDEAPPGIVYASLDLGWSAQHALDFAGSANATLSVVDTRSETILLRSPDPDVLAGRVFSAAPLLRTMRANPAGGAIETADLDGTPEVFGFAPLDAGGGSGLMVAVGLSRAAVLADADARFALGIALALVTALAAAGLAWLLGDRTQHRAIRSLVDAARRLGAGDLRARASMAGWEAHEFRTLSNTLGDMANGIATAQASLSESEHQLRLLADNSTDMILRVRYDGQRIYASPACRSLLGWTPEEMLRISTFEAIHPEDRGLLKGRSAFSDGEAITLTYRMRRKDGSYIWVEAVSRTMPPEPGQPPERIVVVRDVEQRVAAELRLKDSEARYRLLAEHGTDMVFELDLDLARRYVSPACREILGYEPEDLIGTKPVSMIHPDDAVYVAEVFQSVLRGEAERSAVVNRIRHRDGRWVWVEAQLRGLKDPRTGVASGIIGALRDVSVRKAAEEQLEEANRRLETLAWEDGLTGLANRRTFDLAAAKEYNRALRNETSLGLIMIDVDRFKAFNDCHGHLAGDECLRQVSRAIRDVFRRPGDVAARYGGEEFAVLLPGTDEAGAAIVADRISTAVRTLNIGHEASAAGIVTISAGVASLDPNTEGGDFETLVRDADRALYRAKDTGRNAIVRASTLGVPRSSAA